MLNIDRKTNFYLIIVTLQLCSYVYAKHFYMRVYLIVRSKSMISLLLEVTEYPILSPDLIRMLVYRPSSSPLSDFDYIITKIREFILSLPAPIPNIILLSDFNMPEVIWENPHAYHSPSELLIDLATLLFLKVSRCPLPHGNQMFLI